MISRGRVPQRDPVLVMVNAHGLNRAIHYPVPIQLQEAYRPLGLQPDSFPVVERVAKGLKDCLAEVSLALG